MAMPRNTPDGVWRYVDKRGEDECWHWTSSISQGYGTYCIHFKHYKAHRVVYFLTYGGIDLSAPISNYDHTHVLHTCDNPICCNPKHLYLGDIFRNMADKVERGRQYRSSGELQANSKLKNEDASEIKAALIMGARTKDLAKVYGVKMNVIYGIKEGRTYRDCR